MVALLQQQPYSSGDHSPVGKPEAYWGASLASRLKALQDPQESGPLIAVISRQNLTHCPPRAGFLLIWLRTGSVLQGSDGNAGGVQLCGRGRLRYKASCIHCSPQTLKRRFSGWWTSLLKGMTLTVDEGEGGLNSGLKGSLTILS